MPVLVDTDPSVLEDLRSLEKHGILYKNTDGSNILGLISVAIVIENAVAAFYMVNYYQ